tara:strand:+ start:672 stop:1100 length:429 start_codon:yes stop_codon:yes gene_type:complete
MSEIDNKRVHLLTRNLLSSEPRVRCGAGIHATAELKAVRSARFGEVTCRACIRRGAQLGERLVNTAARAGVIAGERTVTVMPKAREREIEAEVVRLKETIELLKEMLEGKRETVEMCFEAVDSLKQLLAIREAGEAHEEQGS